MKLQILKSIDVERSPMILIFGLYLLQQKKYLAPSTLVGQISTLILLIQRSRN